MLLLPFTNDVCVCVKSLSRVWLSDPMGYWTVAHQAPLSTDFFRQESWSKLTFPTPGDLPNPGILHCRQILYWLSQQGSPRILEWVAYPFSRGSSQSRNWTRVSCIAGEFLTNWAIRETHTWILSPEELSNPGIEPRSTTLQEILYQLSHQGSPCDLNPAL